MTTTIGDVREAAAAAITVATDLRAFAYLSEILAPPCAYISPVDFDPRMVMGSGVTTYPFQVRLFFAAEADQQMQKLIDQYRDVSGTLSITVALQDGTNWPDNLVQSVSVTRVGELQRVDWQGVAYLIFELDFDVIW